MLSEMTTTRHTMWGTGGVLALALALSACGGGSNGGVSRNPGPAPTPTPSPAPTPTPTPTTNFNTTEVNRSDGPGFHNAISVWREGITGEGVGIAIIDTGIDTDSPEFVGRIAPASRSVAGNSTFDAEDDHGTNVALVAAAALDGEGVVGMAYEAKIIALRADRPGSCATETDDTLDGCEFFDTDIARGVDVAVAAGARVINLSLGGGNPTATLRDAITRAAQAGVVVIVAAGNDGDTTDTDIDPDNPDPFALGLLAAGGNNVIIVGSVDDQGNFSAFSNRAGDYGASFLSARGERICCVYQDGELLIEIEDGQRFVTLFSGTSFAAPQVSGAVALLAQAFPNLTGSQIVELLLDSARDAGDAGTDRTYGTGILDVAVAFAPRGTTSIAGTRVAVAPGTTSVIGSTAMGDALANGGLETIVTDKYNRPYSYDLAAGAKPALRSPVLRNALERRTDMLAGANANTALAFTVDRSRLVDPRDPVTQLRLTPQEAEGARILAATVASRIAPDTHIGFAFSQGSAGLVAQMQGQERPAFLIAKDAAGESGYARRSDTSIALRHEIGEWGLTLSAESGDILLGNLRESPALSPAKREKHAMQSVGVAFDRDFGKLEASAGLNWIGEKRTVLGAYLDDMFGGGGADSAFIDAGFGWRFAPAWRFGARARGGITRAKGGGFVEGSGRMWSQGWSLDLVRDDILQTGDTLGFRISQPLRVESGGVDLDVPVGFDWESGRPSYGVRTLDLSPSGRELTGELAWRGEVWDGFAGASLFYRHEPGHIADAPADIGAAITFERGF